MLRRLRVSCVVKAVNPLDLMVRANISLAKDKNTNSLYMSVELLFCKEADLRNHN